MAKEWQDASYKENNSRRNDENGVSKSFSSSTSMTNSPPRKYSGNGNNGNWRELYNHNKPENPFIQQQIPRNYTFQPPKHFIPRKYPPQTNYSRNYKQEEKRHNRLPAFTFNNLKYRNNSANIQGYRNPKYFNNNKFKKYTKPNDIETDEVEVIVSSKSIESDFIDCSMFESSPVIKEEVLNHASSYFQIKTINSYKEFSHIKAKSLINLPSKYETISFLKALLPNPKQPIILFFDQNDRVFYGAAVVCLDEFLEREEFDTSTIEILSLKLNWIFLAEVEESTLNFNVNINISEPLDPQNGLEVLKLMEELETRLHDVKKIKPLKLRLKLSRLEELEDFFRLTESRSDCESTNTDLIDYSMLKQMDTHSLSYSMTKIMAYNMTEMTDTVKNGMAEMIGIQNNMAEVMTTQTFNISDFINTDKYDMPESISSQTHIVAEVMNTQAHVVTDIPAITPITSVPVNTTEIISNDDDDDFFDDYF